MAKSQKKEELATEEVKKLNPINSLKDITSYILTDPQKTKTNPLGAGRKKGSTKESSETLAKAHATRAENLEKGL
jgi:hypothetical protein